MNITKENKRKYSSPKLNCTILDGAISLELQSEPPIGPGESLPSIGQNNLAPEFFNKNNPLNA